MGDVLPKDGRLDESALCCHLLPRACNCIVTDKCEINWLIRGRSTVTGTSVAALPAASLCTNSEELFIYVNQRHDNRVDRSLQKGFIRTPVMLAGVYNTCPRGYFIHFASVSNELLHDLCHPRVPADVYSSWPSVLDTGMLRQLTEPRIRPFQPSKVWAFHSHWCNNMNILLSYCYIVQLWN